MEIRYVLAPIAITAGLAACDSGDIIPSPTTVDNSAATGKRIPQEGDGFGHRRERARRLVDCTRLAIARSGATMAFADH